MLLFLQVPNSLLTLPNWHESYFHLIFKEYQYVNESYLQGAVRESIGQVMHNRGLETSQEIRDRTLQVSALVETDLRELETFAIAALIEFLPCDVSATVTLWFHPRQAQLGPRDHHHGHRTRY